MDKELKRQIILDNYENPFHKEDKENYLKINANNESCIDNLDLYFKIEDNIIKDIAFNGEACAISTSATSIMLKNIIGKDLKYVKEIIKNYEAMLNEEDYDKNILNDLIVYDETHLQPNRKNCALLPVKAIKKILD